MVKKIAFIIISSIILIYFFSYKLLDVPMGLTADETAFGRNAALLAKTGFDENGRHYPVFVLSNDGTDWKQPVTQYYITIFYKLFGSTVYNLRLSTVFITLTSFFLIYFYFSPIAAIIFLTVPLVMIQTHLALDNIMPIPFALIWLIGLKLYSQNKKIRHLIYSALALGISFYTYKGMRAVTPVWATLSCLYIFFLNKYSFKKIKPIIVFSLSILPFFLLVPVFNHIYPGSILGGSHPVANSPYDFFYPYLSSFDFTFLFIKGDATPYHSTGIHGMFLLSTLPLFLYGIYLYLKKKDHFSNFILFALFLAPILYGLIGSIHRASRLMVIIPLFVFIITESITYLVKNKKIILLSGILLLMTINYIDFLTFYYGTYRKYTQNFVGTMSPYKSFEILSKQSKLLKLTPYVSDNIKNYFFQAAYFDENLINIEENITLPKNSILLTERENIPGMRRLPINLEYYNLQIVE